MGATAHFFLLGRIDGGTCGGDRAAVTRIDEQRRYAARRKGEARGRPARAVEPTLDAAARREPLTPADLRALVDRTVAGLGYELVELERAAGGLMRVTVDTLEPPGAVGLDDCERVSRQLTHLFAVEQVNFERLEVSSPGLDRPLIAARDYRRFAGAPVQLQLRAPLNGRRRWRGRLLGLCGEAGAERVQLTVAAGDGAMSDKDSDKAAKAAGRVRSGSARAAAAAGAETTVELPLAEVEKARLVPQFDFRSAQIGLAKKANKEGRR